MQIQVRDLEYCKIEVYCLANADDISEKKSEVVKIFKGAPVPGFRKGKATKKVIENFYKNQINDSLKKALMEECYHQAMFDKQFKPIGYPKFSEAFLKDDLFSCKFEVLKQPDFDLEDFRKWEIESPKLDVTVELIYNKMMTDLQNLYGERVPLTDEEHIESGNIASLSYDVYLEGQKIEDMSSDGDVVSVGSSKIKDFDKNIIGMRVGEEKEFTINVPENGGEFSGKDLKFNVKVNMAMKIVPSNLDDDFAEKAGKENLEQLKKDVTSRAEKTYSARLQAVKNSAIIKKLIDSHKFKVPEWLAIDEAKSMLQRNKMDWNTASDQLKSQAFNQASNNIKLSLILQRISDFEPEAQLSQSELLQYAVNYLSLNKRGSDSIEDMMKNLSNTGQLQILLNKLRDENVVNFLNNAVKFI